MAKRATFPFTFIAMWARPQTTTGKACVFCKQESTYVLYHFVAWPNFNNPSGLAIIDMDDLWSAAITRQMAGNYQIAYYQPVCLDCCIHFSSIQLGKTRPIKQLLTLMSIASRQQGEETSLVVCVTVKSLYDQGDTSAEIAPNTTIEDVVKHIQTS